MTNACDLEETKHVALQRLLTDLIDDGWIYKNRFQGYPYHCNLGDVPLYEEDKSVLCYNGWEVYRAGEVMMHGIPVWINRRSEKRTFLKSKKDGKSFTKASQTAYDKALSDWNSDSTVQAVTKLFSDFERKKKEEQDATTCEALQKALNPELDEEAKKLKKQCDAVLEAYITKNAPSADHLPWYAWAALGVFLVSVGYVTLRTFL